MYRIFFALALIIYSHFIFGMSPVIDLRKTKDHIAKKFAEVAVNDDPYPHLVIQNILPSDLYDQMQFYWPDSSTFDHQNRVNKHLYITQGCAEQRNLTTDQKLFWRIFGEVVMGYIKEHVIQSLMPYLNWKFPNLTDEQLEKIKNEICFFNSRQDSLMEHHYGYYIPPHVDQAYVFAAMLLYCPPDNSHIELGTTLLVSPQGITSVDTNYSGNPRDLKNFIVHKKAPYLPNTLFVMLQNPWQWHSSEVQNDSKYVRKMYLSNLLLAPEFVEKMYPSSVYKYDIYWMYYNWENQFLKYQP